MWYSNPRTYNMNTHPFKIAAATLMLGTAAVSIIFLLLNRNTPMVSGTSTTAGSYNGPLFLTSEKTGSEAPFSSLLAQMQKHDVKRAIFYFEVEPDEGGPDDRAAILKAIRSAPGRIVPFFSPGYSSQEAKPRVGSTMVADYTAGYNTMQSASAGLLKGIGEVEMYAWPVAHDDPKLKLLFQFAADRKLAVMLHPRSDGVTALGRIAAAYPNTTFIFHMFQTDFANSRPAVIALLKKHKNLVFTIDVDHLLFDGHTGLLYKYENEPTASAVKKFVADYDANGAALVGKAGALYRPLVAAAPTQVTIGTELSTDYSYNPAVYDRIIRTARLFLGSLPATQQAGVAYNNADRLFGAGASIR